MSHVPLTYFHGLGGYRGMVFMVSVVQLHKLLNKRTYLQYKMIVVLSSAK